MEKNKSKNDPKKKKNQVTICNENSFITEDGKIKPGIGVSKNAKILMD